jgi:serine/threonine protein kinase
VQSKLGLASANTVSFSIQLPRACAQPTEHHLLLIDMSFESEPTIIGSGWTAIVTLYDECSVLKGYEVWVDGRCRRKITPNDSSKTSQAREDIVYKRLGSHPHIPKYYGLVKVAAGVYSLRLELAQWGNLRDLIVATRQSPPPLDTRLKMALQTSFTLAYIHSKSVFHCDISCRNIFVCPGWCVKIGDFGGSKIDNEAPLDVAEEVRYELPLRGRKWEARPFIKRELFALGSTICEIMAWKKPYEELKDEEVVRNYAEEKFPDVTELLVGSVIYGCWNEQFDRAEDVGFALRDKTEHVYKDLGFGD